MNIYFLVRLEDISHVLRIADDNQPQWQSLRMSRMEKEGNRWIVAFD